LFFTITAVRTTKMVVTVTTMMMAAALPQFFLNHCPTVLLPAAPPATVAPAVARGSDSTDDAWEEDDSDAGALN